MPSPTTITSASLIKEGDRKLAAGCKGDALACYKDALLDPRIPSKRRCQALLKIVECHRRFAVEQYIEDSARHHHIDVGWRFLLAACECLAEVEGRLGKMFRHRAHDLMTELTALTPFEPSLEKVSA